LIGSGNAGPAWTFQAVVDTAFEHAAH
jgi:hypothetical protein